MKISEDDIKKILDGAQDKPVAHEPYRSELRNLKVSKFKGDEIKKIRHEIKKVKSAPKKKLDIFWEEILRFLAVSGFSGFVIFTIMGSSGFYSQLKWVYFTNYLGEKVPSANYVSSTPVPTSTPTPDTIALPSFVPAIPNSDGNFLKSEKISLQAPIVWDVPEDAILERLRDGVVHYAGTSHPGEGGNIFIVGHSSNYFWIKSDYNSVFALLDKLERGDRLEIQRNGKSYFYDVEEKKVINPGEVEILQNTQKETLTLMTCWPIGTSLQRLIVQAQYVYSSN